jgi:hypothetical protein
LLARVREIGLEDGLKELWGEQGVSVYQLAPLRRKDVAIAVEACGMAPDAFLKEVEEREAVPFAIKPLTLTFLLNCFRRTQTFPASKAALFFEGCRGLCEESDDRRDVGRGGNLSADARVHVASRIAALTVLGGFSAVWKGPDRGDVPVGDLAIRRITGGTERVTNMDVVVDEQAISEVLGTGLFTSKGLNRLCWSHQTYADFLAARFLVERNLTPTQVMSLITLPDDKEGKLAPQLHETAAWLASLRPEFFRRIMESDPAVLLLSDVTTADRGDRERLVGTLLQLYDEEKLLDSNWGLRNRYQKLAHPNLPEQLLPYVTDPQKGAVVRRVAIDIAEACALTALQSRLADVALNASDNLPTRVQAAYAVSRIGDAETRLRLKPLALEPHAEDAQDELKGCALKALWPDAWTAEEVFSSLTAPKQNNLYGAYASFLTSTLLDGLTKDHLPAALAWLRRQRTRNELPSPLEQVSDCVMKLAWENLDEEGVAEPFSEVVADRLRNHDTLFGTSQHAFRDWLITDATRRRRLVMRLVLLLPEEEARLIAWRVPGVGRGEDFLWLLAQLESCTDKRVRARWLRQLVLGFDVSDQIHLQAVHAATDSNPSLAAAFSGFVNPVELSSLEASRQREAFEQHEQAERELHEMNSRAAVASPTERVLNRLQQCEAGNQNAWWRLNLEMTLEIGSTHWGDELEGDLTALPGWEASDEGLRERIVASARRYLEEADPQTTQWLGQDVWHRGAAAGYRAFLLLLQERPEALQEFDVGTWNKWVAALLAYPTAGTLSHSSLYQELLRQAYAKAGQEMIRALLVLIEHENDQSEYLTVTDKVSWCTDPTLMAALYDKCQDEKLKPGFVSTLLGFLLERNHPDAHSLATSLVRIPPPPTEGRERNLALGAAAALLRHAGDGGWKTVWPAFQADRQFGRDVVSAISPNSDVHGHLVSRRLTEEDLGDLYLWLTETYPESVRDEAVTWLGPSDFASEWRHGIHSHLQTCGTEKSCEVLARLMRALPQQTSLKWVLQNAREATRQRNWKPADPDHILLLASDSSKRLVRDGEELLAVILESLERLTTKLRGETPLAANLWNELPAGVWEPKEEEHLSDNIKQHLDDELRAKGVVLNREVVIRRNRGKAKGERTDIHVDAIVRGGKGDDLDIVTVIIEAKGCWHKELWVAMRAQLVERYLKETRARHGLYLVGWFNCLQWNREDTRKPPQLTLQEAQRRLDTQAGELSQGKLLVKAFVLDTSLR